jgi:ABC-type nitrate/sulfonate/bicarbonate transport system substrate-binding protein
MKMPLGVIIFLCSLLGFVNLVQGQKIKLAVPSESIQQVAFYVAQKQGYYQQEGLEVELILMSGRVGNLALLGGDVHFGAAPGGVFAAVQRGVAIRVLFTAFHAPMHWLYAKPEISDVRNLKGKRIAVSSIGAATHFLLRDTLKRHGIEDDVVVLGMGVQSTRFGALVNGSVDAAMLTFPLIFSAQELGFRELVSFLKEGSVQLAGSVVAQESLLKSNPSMVRKFLRATLKGLRYSWENPDGTKRLLAQRLRIKEDLADKVYTLARPGMTKDGTLSDELQKGAVDLAFNSLEVKGIPPAHGFFDFSLIRDINEELKTQGWKPQN